MQIRALKLPGAYEIQLEPRGDARGYFKRTYDEAIFREHGLVTSWVQENESFSTRKGIIRGLHFQTPPHAETKLVRVAEGAVLDVFVDLRRDSPTFGQWASLELSAENHTAAYIPKGFAHGFCTLTDRVAMLYKVDAFYAPQFEGGLRWDDPEIAIPWPTDEPLLSEKDLQLPALSELESPF